MLSSLVVFYILCIWWSIFFFFIFTFFFQCNFPICCKYFCSHLFVYVLNIIDIYGQWILFRRFFAWIPVDHGNESTPPSESLAKHTKKCLYFIVICSARLENCLFLSTNPHNCVYLFAVAHCFVHFLNSWIYWMEFY